MKIRHFGLALLLCLLATAECFAVAPTKPMASASYKVQGSFTSALGNADSHKMTSSNLVVLEGSFYGVGDVSYFTTRRNVLVHVSGVDTSHVALAKRLPGFLPAVSPTDVPYHLYDKPMLRAPNVIYADYAGQANAIRYVLTGWSGTGGIVDGIAESGTSTIATPGTISAQTPDSSLTWVYKKQVRVKVQTSGEDTPLKVYDRSGDTQAGSTLVNNISPVDISIGMEIFGNGIPAGTTVAAIDALAETITLDTPATQTFSAAAGQRLSFSPPSTSGSAPQECPSSSAGSCNSGTVLVNSGINFYDASTSSNVSLSAAQSFSEAGGIRTLTQQFVTGGGSSTIESILNGRKLVTVLSLDQPMTVEWRYDDTKIAIIGQPLEPSAVMAVDFDPATNLVVANSHGRANGDMVEFSAISTTTGIAINSEYYVVNRTDDSFQLAATAGGTALTLTNSGSGALKQDVDFSQKPVITLLAAALQGDTVGAAFIWAWDNSHPDRQRKKYFPIHPVDSFSIEWPLVGGSSFVETTTAVWPVMQQHIAEVPANLQPQGAKNSFNSISYTTNGAVSMGVFNSTAAGMSVLRFNTPGIAPDWLTGATFIVVETTEKLPNDRLTETAWDIGKKITYAGHQDPEGDKTGYLFYAGGAYDGTGTDKAYDRSTRDGAIIPVNVSTANGQNPLVVVWYETGLGGIGWPTIPMLYTSNWPANPPFTLTIGTGIAVSPTAKPNAKIYNQPHNTQPGFNPNEEHALLSGDTLYAMRDDLNDILDESEPYVLVKYNSGTEWAMDVYRVSRPAVFTYDVAAGQAIVAPLPASLQIPPKSGIKKDINGFEVGGEWHLRDYKGGHWAKAANWGYPAPWIEGDPVPTPPVTASEFVMRWYYYMQPGFYWPIRTGYKTINVGDPVPFLSDGTIYTDASKPIDVTYRTHWASAAPSLSAGDTLTTARDGLPAIYGFQSAEVVFDENVYQGKGPLAKLYAPERYLYAALAALPGGIKTEVGIGGVFTFPDLPYVLQSRLFYDNDNGRLGFKGTWISAEGEAPWLLPNLMTPDEQTTLEGFVNDLDWQAAIKALYDLARNPDDLDYPPTGNIANPFDPGNAVKAKTLGEWKALWGIPLGLELSGTQVVAARSIVGEKNALSAGMAQGEGYVVIAENNNIELDPAPVVLHVLKVAKNPVFRGIIKAIKSKNVFDEKLTLHYTGDFGGEPEKFTFDWYYQPVSGSMPSLPLPGSAQTDDNWTKFIVAGSDSAGLTDITIEGASPLTLSDNWFAARYYYKNAWPANSEDSDPLTAASAQADNNNWSDWSGANLFEPLLATGWVKRVVDGLNPLEARVTDFRNSATNTTVSMLSQFGPRHDGAIALNSSAANLNSLGLIAAYETVLDRSRAFSIDAVPAQNYGPTNDSLLNISSRLATFYLALGNEAYADAVDPTIGFSTKSAEYGNMASSVFSFQNQLESLLDEELTLMRGRDDSATTTRNAPYYNRLIWNFTQGEGEVAYAQNYNVTDQDNSGLINAGDAKIMYPQGHGDAWGHYLQAINYYYKLIGHSNFSWEPRVEFVTVAGNPIMVDYLDERKFASVAAARAKVGAEILDLTYKKFYTDDPAGQWQGYKDSYPDRAWGVDEWARRAGQAAVFDWVTANAILPDGVSATAHDRTRYVANADGVLVAETIPGADIQQIDRGKVLEIASIASQFQQMQSKMNEVDAGINPLGLVKGTVPFDIDPVQVSNGKTHFEQIYERAAKALESAIVVYDYANGFTQRLRQNQDTLEEFKKNLTDQERDYKNRLIEIFGYPYPDDIGAGKTYPDGYDGPDIWHYAYVDRTELTGDAPGSYTTFTTTLSDPASLEKLLGMGAFTEGTRTVAFNIDPEHKWLAKPSDWELERRAPGKIQRTLSELLVVQSTYNRALQKFDGMVGDIEAAKDNLQSRYNVLASQIQIQDANLGQQGALDVAISLLHTTSIGLHRTADTINQASEIAAEALPTVVGVASDVTSPARAGIRATAFANAAVLHVGGDIADGTEFYLERAKERVQSGMELQLVHSDANYELSQQLLELQDMVSDVDQQLLDTYILKESAQQAEGNYLAALAEGLRLMDERMEKRAQSSAEVQEYRFQDLGFRVFRNDAIQKYRAQFDLAAKYVYLAATAYDYETNLLGTDAGAGRKFLGDIARQRALGVVSKPLVGSIGTPIAGFPGLADIMARLAQNFDVYKTQLGFNNPQTETTPFSLRTELFRIRSAAESDADWRDVLKNHMVDDLWKIPEFKKYCRPFAPESAGAQPGIVIKFPTMVTYGKNFFGWPLGGGDSAYSSSNFSTRVRSVGLWFQNYNGAGLSSTPRVYLVPTGTDVLRSPTGDGFTTREWQVRDQHLPVPFPIGYSDLTNADFIPENDSLSSEMSAIRRVSDFRAYPYSGSFNPSQATSDSRLIGRSVWNSEWMLIIPASTLLFNKDVGLKNFIDSVDDIKMFFQTYSYSGN